MREGTCALCLNERPLVRSHVLPEFLCEQTYTAKHAALSFNSDLAHVRILKKGVREPLLCVGCERILKEYEDYFAIDWLQARRIPNPLPEGAVELRFEGLDYRRFKLFHLSIAWRTGVAAGQDYAPIALGEHGEPLRSMLIKGDPWAIDSYPVFGCVLRMRSQPRAAMGVIALSTTQPVGGYAVTSTIYAGCNWYCVLGQDASTEFSDLYLRVDGTLSLPIEGIESRSSLVDLVKGRDASFRKAVRKIS
jgi:hypothetical protein